MKAVAALERMAFAQAPPPAASAARFPDGASFRVEIPSVAGARAGQVVRSWEEHEIVVNRVSQGSGAMPLRESQMRGDGGRSAPSASLEVSLFTGPREGLVHRRARAPATVRRMPDRCAGLRGLAYAVEDIARACEAGIRSFLISDAGLLDVLVDMQGAGRAAARASGRSRS